MSPLLQDPLAVLAAIAGAIALSEWLARNTALRHVGTSLLVIVVTAVFANLGLVPTVGQGSAVYDHAFGVVLDLAVFWLLLNVRLGELRRAGPAMLGLFVLGALGVAAGVSTGMWVVGGAERFGENGAGLGAMFVGTYTGGSANFNLLARSFAVNEEPTLYAGAAVIDSLMTTIWMVLGVAIPRWLGAGRGEDGEAPKPQLGIEEDTEAIHPLDIALLVGLGAAAVSLSGTISAWLRDAHALNLAPSLVLTTLALLFAQLPFVARLRGTRSLGMFAVYLFLAAIGALCDIHELIELRELGAWMLLFVAITLAVHGLVSFGAARLFGISPDVAAVASQANVGGGSTALALARSLGRPDLVLPALLVGNLGTALGTYLGAFVGTTMLGGTLSS